jgi:hypothetical protein
MAIARLIVLERDGRWAAAARREINDEAVRLVEVRSWDECWQRLAEQPSALIAAELTETNIDACLAGLHYIESRFPHAALLVLADRKLEPCRALLREAGALHFITSPRRLGEVKAILGRRRNQSYPAIRASNPLDQIIAELPWSESLE